MNKLKVNSVVERKIKSGAQLLEKKDFDTSLVNQLVQLFSQSNQFLGMAYLSPQNKGIGWLLSRQVFDFNHDYFVSLFEKSREKRQKFEKSSQTTAYRLFNQDGDNFGGLTIDFYSDYALFSWYNEFVYTNRQMIVAAFKQVYPNIKGAYEKIRFKGLDFESAHLYGQEAPESFLILENNIKYSVFLNDGLMTGIFLDQHDVRKALATNLSEGKKVLNMFSYTAAFSVAAAVGGALETTSVDLAKRSRELSKAHFDANQIVTDNHRFIVMDVFEYYKYAKRKHLSYDVIVIDPPSFARNKKQTFSVTKDYYKLIEQALDILTPGGTIIASINAANLTVSQFKKQLEKGFGKASHNYISLQQLPEDFTVNDKDQQSNYLKVFTIKVK
ncbi:TPA: class I SAM-dependent rRNA methyltransferase [Streptococcus agalactiae]